MISLGADCDVPLASAKPTVRVDEASKSSTFFDDEFVVYSEAQVRLRYVVRIVV